jgi:membrane fusion protein (multidrug efflux system)
MLRDSEVALKEAQDAEAKGTIARREAEGAIEKSRLAFEQAKRNYERNEAARLISAQDLEKLQLDMETADAELEAMILAKDRSEIEGRAAATAIGRAQLAVERAQIALSHTELRAPFAGVIADRKCQVGESITAANEAFTLTDLSNLRTVFYRPQRELALFTGLAAPSEGDGLSGIEVTAESEALPGHTFAGHIERISPEIESASGSFRVTVRLDPVSDGLRLLPGMLLRLKLVVERHPNSLVVSKRALRREGDSTVLFVVRDDRARRVVVEERFSDDEVVEVAVLGEESLEEGDLVVVVGNRDLEDDKEVEVTVEDAAPWIEEVEPEEQPTVVETASETVEPDEPAQ